MGSVTESVDFGGLFESCRTIAEANSLYKTLFVQHDGTDAAIFMALSEAHRRAMERMSIEVRVEQQAAARPEPSNGRLRPHVLRNWCRQQGIPLAKKGRVPAEIENRYRSEHGMDLLPSKEMTNIPTGVEISHGVVREWARQNGVRVTTRGRVGNDVIAKYLEAQHEE